ncbi:alpha/beta fold hydrolase [Amycolatopsis sacchari]|uniref:Pimeloyl-ACP methyl ester carboxylesterase n=1 Tax=Amycolatopsis sacchari TaxID=115433 RepID=A0A1I3LVU5_9PSEU|nr:alpha/beta hydrolase [Amycolatopsis sacchari]SFI88635.1 Pimeloyl-ACP methyl ester carboxylesterase [Amycolatopsis sacchari]
MNISGFPDERSRRRYLEVYDSLLDWPLPAEDRTVETRHGSTYVRYSAGDGLPLVLLHGFAVTSLSWQPFVAGLKRPVYAIDSLGEPGRSVQTAPLRDAAEAAEWLADVFTGLGLWELQLVGMSRGGWLALNQALKRPDGIVGVTAIEPACLAPMGFRQYRWMAAGLALALAPRAIRRRFEGSARYGVYVDPLCRPLVLAQAKHRTKVVMPKALTDEEWRSLRVPVDIVLGALSPLHDAEREKRRIQALNPEITVEVVPGAGHGPDVMVSGSPTSG